MLKSSREYAYDGPRLAVQANRLTGDLRIRVESAFPKRVAEYDYVNAPMHLRG